jgi:hypothetical protein
MTCGSRRVENMTFLLGLGLRPPPGARFRFLPISIILVLRMSLYLLHVACQ